MEREHSASASFLAGPAEKLFPYRWPLFVLALGMTLVAILPPLAVAHYGVTPPSRFWTVFFISAPISLWAWALLLVPVWFHPQLGTLGVRNPATALLSPGLLRALRAWAILSLFAFLLAPGVVTLAR
ncbi:MAG: hypothetical protein HKP30_18415 [Myxococcales bacterium]|nr:hypothetical protein [Myxococcales bacterium]